MRGLSFLLLITCVALQAQKPTPIIFDTDIGDDIDDALALALALQSPELDVRAVTTVIDDVESRTRLAWKELGIYHRQDIALAMGASEPLLDPVRTFSVPQFKALTEQDIVPPKARRRAADLIVETLLASPDKITLVPVGPLTNIALALKLDPRIKEKIERIVLMGGSFEKQVAEYNIGRDRFPAQIVFQSGVPITAVGLDVTMKCKLEAADLARLRNARNPAPQFLVQLVELWQDGKPDKLPILHDPLAVEVAMQPSLIETQLGQVEVENGVTLFRPQQSATTKVAVEVNVRAFLDLFLNRLTK